MKKNIHEIRLFLLPFLLLAGGCTYHAYFQSPFHSDDAPYHAIPLRSDSLRSAIYGSGVITSGWANENGRDQLTSFTGYMHRAHNFGAFEGYYGIDYTLGAYQIGNFKGLRPAPGVDSAILNKLKGSKSFGGYGLNGGINYTFPFARGSEIRFPSLSLSTRREYGAYLRLRQGLPDSAANTIFTGNFTATMTAGTEIVFKTREGSITYGIKLGWNLLNQRADYRGNDAANYPMQFWSQTLSGSIQQFSFYGQLNVGNYTATLQLGLQYQWAKRARSHVREN